MFSGRWSNYYIAFSIMAAMMVIAALLKCVGKCVQNSTQKAENKLYTRGFSHSIEMERFMSEPLKEGCERRTKSEHKHCQSHNRKLLPDQVHDTSKKSKVGTNVSSQKIEVPVTVHQLGSTCECDATVNY